MAKMGMLDLINPINCRKLLGIYSEENEEGRDVCTSPPQNISSLDQLSEKLLSIALPDQPYRTLLAEIQDSIEDDGHLTIPTNRGVSISASPDAPDGTSITSLRFTATSLAELYIERINLVNNTRVFVEEEGLVEIASCTVSHKSAFPPFLENAGEAVLTSVDILGYTSLENNETGQLSLTYVEFWDYSTLSNSDKGVVELSRMTLYEDFVEPSTDNLGGKVILAEATRRYDYLDDEESALCFGNDLPDLTLQLDSLQCQEQCEDEFTCSGVLVYFDEDNNGQCDFCLRDKDCAFNCSAVNSLYYKPESNFYYTSVLACPALSRAFEPLEGATLEQCKLYSQWFKCEYFLSTLINL